MNIRTFFRKLKNPELDLIDFTNLAYLGKRPVSFHGHTQLDLLRDGKVVHRVEKSNTITGWVGNSLSAGNFFNQIATDKIYPLSQWFSGCFLTDETNDPTLAMIAGNTNIVAQAGNAGYSGTNPKMGTFNGIESRPGVDPDTGKCYIRNVWDWGTSAGNCGPNQYIKSVCLTRGELGYVDQNSAVTPYDMNIFNPLLGSSSFAYEPFHAMNPATGKVYFVDYTSGDTKIVVTERFTNTNKIHLLGSVAGDIQSESHEVPISAAIPSFSRERASVNLDVANGILHFYTWTISGSGSNQTTTLYDYAIDTANFTSTVTATTLTIQGCHFISSYDFIRGSVILNDWNGHIWAMADVDGTTKFIKVTISNLDIDEYPVILSENGEWWRDNAAPFLLLNNGDWVKYSGNQNREPMVAWYYHNGEITYMANAWDRNLNQYSAVDLGGVFLESYEYNNTVRVVAGYPYVSTVNNLESGSEVRKTSDLSMKLTYTITEV